MQTSFSAGRALGRSVAILFSNAGAFVLMTMLVNVPIILFSVWEASRPHLAADPGKPSPRAAISLAAGIIATALASAAVTYGVLQQLRDKPAGFRDCFRFGFARIPAVLGVSFVAGLLEVAGALLCLAPGFFAASVLFVAVPAAVVEGTGIGGSLIRSSELTRGSRWSTLGLVLLLGLMSLFAFVFVVSLSFDRASKTIVETPTSVLLSAFITVPIQALHAVVTTVVYHDLRVAREGVTSDDLASSFDAD